MTSFDVVFIGAGHNALVAAAYLAKAGRSVCLLEQGDRPGGLVRSEESRCPDSCTTRTRRCTRSWSDHPSSPNWARNSASTACDMSKVEQPPPCPFRTSRVGDAAAQHGPDHAAGRWSDAGAQSGHWGCPARRTPRPARTRAGPVSAAPRAARLRNC
ncbi:NAD(P)-binding protein [Kibdelosporangium aridum]|uniref:NAD(P)-binding protein n=1 Tax=Kibdelosporangium aridum TaxID=2030 RepID=UPI00117A90D4